MKRHLRVSFSSFWVFKSVGCWIKSVSVDIHRKFWHIALIKLDIGQFVACKVPLKGTHKSKLFFIHPVCNSVDNLIFLPICCYLLGGSRNQIFYIEVVFKTVCNFTAIVAKGWLLNFMRRNQSKFLCVDVVNVIGPNRGAAINRCPVCCK